jgi:hydrogenase/urease accessory protein HupE
MIAVLSRFSAVWLLMCSMLASAHAPGLSSLELDIEAQQLTAKATFALQDIEFFAPMDSDGDAEVSEAERDAAKPAIAKLIGAQLSMQADGQDAHLSDAGNVQYDEQNNAHVELHWQPGAQRDVWLQSNFLSLLPEGHQQYVTVKDGQGHILQEKMLGKSDHELHVAISKSVAESSTFWDFFKLGIEHILTGYDHLLFLLALLAVTHGFWPAFRIITFFTLAHSITLALAGLNIVELPSSFVEPFIALTIMYVALENLIRGEHPRGRQWLTFGFGLIHGFGFASVLRELEIGGDGGSIIVPLLSFNLGIETGQIAVASVVLPIIWQLNRKPQVARVFLRGVSLLVAVMGFYWLLERTVLA